MKGHKWGHYGNVRVCEYCYKLVKLEQKKEDKTPSRERRSGSTFEKGTSTSKLLESGFNVMICIQTNTISISI